MVFQYASILQRRQWPIVSNSQQDCLDVAIEALLEALRAKPLHRKSLAACKVCRVSTVIRPYLEAI